LAKDTAAMASSSDRRKRKRASLHWPVRLFRQSGKPPVESTTENLSSEGLYCITREPFKRGEHLQCMIVIPETAVGLEFPILLECHISKSLGDPKKFCNPAVNAAGSTWLRIPVTIARCWKKNSGGPVSIMCA
jgi:hypothetical protein